MRRLCLARLGVVVLLVSGAIDAGAVSKQEMEQARALAAKAWMRCANNGSDYLDGINPKSLSELEGRLKAAEQENIKKFKAVAVAGDYASWNKERLAQYWSAVFLSDPSLKIDNLGYAKKMAYNAVNAMKVSEAEASKPDEAEEATTETTTLPNPIAEAETSTPSATDATDAALQAAEDSLMNLEAERTVKPQQSDDGGTALYIIILCVLVAAVIALVLYATKVFKKTTDDDDDFEDSPTRQRSQEAVSTPQTTVMIQTPPHPSSNEVDMEKNRLMTENAELRRMIDDYKAHIRNLKDQLSEYEKGANTFRQPEVDKYKAAERGRTRRTIYLGRANRDGIFLRAEKELNPEQTIYRLVSTDGLTGTFTIADDIDVERRILADPHLIEYGTLCTGMEEYDHDGVVTDRSGTAIFESGRWRVLRKAHVRLL